MGKHTLEVEYRAKMSSSERSYFWIRFYARASEASETDKGALDRVLSEWFFTLSKHFTTNVNWLQVALDVDDFRPLYGYTESSSKIWIKVDKQTRFSFYPVADHYLFEVRNEDIRKPIQHHRFGVWLDDLKSNLLGRVRPDDQIRFDLVI